MFEEITTTTKICSSLRQECRGIIEIKINFMAQVMRTQKIPLKIISVSYNLISNTDC